MRLSVQGGTRPGARTARCPACECVSTPGPTQIPARGLAQSVFCSLGSPCPRGPHRVVLAVCGWQASPAGLPPTPSTSLSCSEGRGVSPADSTRQERLRVPAPLTCVGPSGSQDKERSWWRRRNRPNSGPKREVKPSAFSSPLPQFTSPENRPGRTEQGWLPNGGGVWGGLTTESQVLLLYAKIISVILRRG